MRNRKLLLILLILLDATVGIFGAKRHKKVQSTHNKKQNHAENFIESAQDPIDFIAEQISQLGKTSKDSNSLLHDFAGILSIAGPAASLASAALSIITAFLPAPENPEFEFMKNSFNKVIDSLSAMEDKVDDLKFTTIHEVTKSVYGEYQRIITSLFMNWQEAINATSKRLEQINRAIFLKQFEVNYNDAASHLFRGLSGYYNNELNNDLLDTAKNRYQCHELKIRKLCVTVANTILQGISVESAYYGYRNFAEKIADSTRTWPNNLKSMNARCESVIRECTAGWEHYAKAMMNDIIEHHQTASNTDLASRGYQMLSNAFGQRTWFVGIYSHVEGSKEIKIDYTNEDLREDVFLRWRKRDKEIFLISLDYKTYGRHQVQMTFSPFVTTNKKVRLPMCQQTEPPEISLATNNVMSFPKVVIKTSKLYVYALKSSIYLTFTAPKKSKLQFHIEMPVKCTASTFSVNVIGFLG